MKLAARITGLLLVTLGGLSAPEAQAANPVGYLDVADTETYRGWARDADSPNSAVVIHFYLDAPAGAAGAVLLGSTVANEYRSDVGAHGFTYYYPKSIVHSGPNPRRVYAYAINIGAGSNTRLYNDGVVTPDTIRLSNGIIEVEVKLTWGGAIVGIWHNGINVVDRNDTGRLVQSAFYESGGYYDPNPGAPQMGWNPVQGGDKYNRGSGILDWSFLGPNHLYVKTRPLEWNPDNKGGGQSVSVRSDVILEQTLRLEAERIFYDITVTNIGGVSHGPTTQEMPCIYMPGDYRSAYTIYYSGTAPWTNAPVTTIATPSFGAVPKPHLTTDLSERWVWMGNASGFGIMNYAQQSFGNGAGYGFRYSGGNVGYHRVDQLFGLPAGSSVTRRGVLLVMNWWDARTWLNANHF